MVQSGYANNHQNTSSDWPSVWLEDGSGEKQTDIIRGDVHRLKHNMNGGIIQKIELFGVVASNNSLMRFPQCQTHSSEESGRHCTCPIKQKHIILWKQTVTNDSDCAMIFNTSHRDSTYHFKGFQLMVYFLNANFPPLTTEIFEVAARKTIMAKRSKKRKLESNDRIHYASPDVAPLAEQNSLKVTTVKTKMFRMYLKFIGPSVMQPIFPHEVLERGTVYIYKSSKKKPFGAEDSNCIQLNDESLSSSLLLAVHTSSEYNGNAVLEIIGQNGLEKVAFARHHSNGIQKELLRTGATQELQDGDMVGVGDIQIQYVHRRAV
jgi:hypothetical protein